MQLYRVGDQGPVIAELRTTLIALGLLQGVSPADAADPAAVFDSACDRALRAFQQQRGLSVDGLVGPETYRALAEARWRLGDRLLWFAVSHPFVGDDVAELQERLLELGFDAGRRDGVFGGQTEAALKEFQRNVGLPVDGRCGPGSLRALSLLKAAPGAVVGGRPHRMREAEALHRSGTTLVGKAVVIDPGHGGGDRGARTAAVDEASVVYDVASRLEGRLAAAGVSAYLTHGADRSPSVGDRARFANETDADLLISLHADAAPSSACHGVATYHFGTGSGAGSTVGERLAALVQRELVARTDLLNCRTHPKTWDILRLTRMPAVRVELGYLSSPTDATRLATPAFRDVIAEAILVAVQRLYLPPDLDPPTGQMRLPVLVGA